MRITLHLARHQLGKRGEEERAGLIAWWAEIFVVPCVAWNVETLEEAANLAALGVDFVALSSTMWETEGAAERIGKIETALLAGLSMA